MSVRLRLLAVSVLVVALAGIVVASHANSERPAPPAPYAPDAKGVDPRPAPPTPPAHRADRARYLAAARAAYTRSRAWWDPGTGWYRQYLPGYGQGAATMWGVVHLFEAASALAIADPTAGNVAAARAFADGAERYWDPNLSPPGYGPSPGTRSTHAWYDDEAWWGVAFFDAYRATGDRRYLGSAARALAFTDSGWDPRRGGIFWDTNRTFKASESLAGATLTAAGLYQETHDPHDLALAKKYIAWANAHLRGRTGLYGAKTTPAGPMPYVQGPMAEAVVRLCKATGKRSWCSSGERLMRATAMRYPKLTMGPQYDALYIRAVLEVYKLDHDRRWYDLAAAATREAMTNAGDARGLYMRTWSGRTIGSIGTSAGKLQTHAATTSLLAWMAAAKPPGS